MSSFYNQPPFFYFLMGSLATIIVYLCAKLVNRIKTPHEKILDRYQADNPDQQVTRGGYLRTMYRINRENEYYLAIENSLNAIHAGYDALQKSLEEGNHVDTVKVKIPESDKNISLANYEYLQKYVKEHDSVALTRSEDKAYYQINLFFQGCN